MSHECGWDGIAVGESVGLHDHRLVACDTIPATPRTCWAIFTQAASKSRALSQH